MTAATDTMRPFWRTFGISSVDPQIGPVAFDGPIQERIDALVDLLAKP